MLNKILNNKNNLLFSKVLFIFTCIWIISTFILSFIKPIRWESLEFIIFALGAVIIKVFIIKEKLLRMGKLRNALYLLISLIFTIALYYIWNLFKEPNLLFKLQGTLAIFLTLLNAESIDSYEYETEWIPKIAILFVVLSVLALFFKFEGFRNIQRLFIFYLLISLIMMHLERQNKFKKKNDKKVMKNFIVINLCFIVVSEKIFNFFVKPFGIAINWLWDKIVNIFVEILKFILYPFLKPLEKLTNKISGWISKNGSTNTFENFQKEVQKMAPNMDNANVLVKDKFDWTPFLDKLKVFIVVSIFILVGYRIYLRLRQKNSLKISDKEQIIREKVELEKKAKKRKRKLRANDNKGKIKVIYWKLLRKAEKKEKYKKYMTVKEINQFSNIDLSNRELEKMGQLYNLTSFSNEKITDEDIEKMKDYYNKVKREY